MKFQNKYPLTAREAVCTPMIFRSGIQEMDQLPQPSLSGIHDFARFSGISDSTANTALHRAKHRKEILVFQDPNGMSRYKISESLMKTGKVTMNRENRPEGFILAVFSFMRDDASERSAVRETLKNYGFKKIAQNTYINGRIETDRLRRDIQELGLEKHLYLFHCPDIEDRELVDKILALFHLQNRMSELATFRQDMTSFLTEDNTSPDDIARKILYLGPIYWERCCVNEPPFPAKYLPSGYPLQEIHDIYDHFVAENIGNLVRYYIQVNQ